jgi:hypothetical protein
MHHVEGAKGQGLPEAVGPSNSTHQHAVRGPCEDAEVVDVWHDRSWRDETAGDDAVPEASNRHDGASLRCRVLRQRFDSCAKI